MKFDGKFVIKKNFKIKYHNTDNNYTCNFCLYVYESLHT